MGNAHLRRRRQSSLKYGQGLHGEAPKFLYHLAIIVIIAGYVGKSKIRVLGTIIDPHCDCRLFRATFSNY